jgi:transposase
VTSAGQRHDSLAFIPLLDRLAIARRGPGRPRTRPGRVLADKAYSSKAIRSCLRRRGIKATIPEPSDQMRGRLRRGSKGGRPPGFDPAAYKQRNTVEKSKPQCCHSRGWSALSPVPSRSVVMKAA